ncbi:MAG: hypothetical protein M0P69_20225 [Bacteroidales bacterium]|nr:hypothetical protein [Bacteroidales bacterium]
MPNRLKGLEVEEVSLVDVPAIRRKFLITKRDGSAATGNTKTEPTQKAASFGQLITARNLDENMWDAFYALKESIYSSLGETNAAELVNKNIAEFTAYLTGMLANPAAITKAQESYKPESTEQEPVQKAGAKISAARLEKLTGLLAALKEGATSLEELLKEVSPAEEQEDNPNEPDPNKDKDVNKGAEGTDPPNPSAGEPTPDNGVAELAKSVGQLTELVQGLVTPDKLVKMVEEQLKTV